MSSSESACADTAVYRSDPEIHPSGECEIETEIIEMQPTGIYDPDLCDGLQLPVVVTLNPQHPTYGAILSSVDEFGLPAFPDTSMFVVNVLVYIGDEGPYEHAIELGNLLENDNLWSPFGQCLEQDDDPYEAGYPQHAHIPCPPDPPPWGCCVLSCEIGDGCFITRGVICELLGGEYLGDGTECDLNQLCQDPTRTEVTTWGSIKSTYK